MDQSLHRWETSVTRDGREWIGLERSRFIKIHEVENRQDKTIAFMQGFCYEASCASGLFPEDSWEIIRI